MPANFASDNVGGASPEIVAALAEAAAAEAMPYGADPWTGRVEARLRDVFETGLTAFPVVTGTAANALALAALTPPWGVIACHPLSHAMEDECGAPEFFSGGARLLGVAGAHARIDPAALRAALADARPHGVHNMRPAALSLTQASEAGTLYRPEAIAELAGVARAHGMAVHMDGARFANAVAALGVGPADLTWRAGVDVLSLGATKNGALAAEAVIFFRPEQAAEFGERRKRGGHLLSKARFVSAQLDAWLAGDLWLANARAANRAAGRLAGGLAALPGVALVHPAEANMVFAALPGAAVAALEADGFGFYRAGTAGEGRTVIRLVAGFATRDADVDAFVAAAARHLAEARDS
jgi:threonine aldolase